MKDKFSVSAGKVSINREHRTGCQCKECCKRGYELEHSIVILLSTTDRQWLEDRRKYKVTCKDRVTPHLKSRLHELELIFKAYQNGEEGTIRDEKNNDELPPFNEYGLCFDCVAPGSFITQRRGYFRNQLSTGGPGDEFRFYADEQLNTTKIEYWFLDWFDGAKIILHGKDLALLNEIWEFFKEVESVQAELDKAS